MRQIKLCLKHRSGGVVQYTLEGVTHYVIITRENFWRRWRWIRAQFHPKMMANEVLAQAQPQICGTGVLEDVDVDTLIGLANDAERLHQLPWDLLPGMRLDRGALLGWCRIAWAAKSAWEQDQMPKPKDDTG